MAKRKPKDERRMLDVERLDGDRVRFEYRFREQYVRRMVSMEALTGFLTGGVELSRNLAPGAAPVELEKFLLQEYLPKCARPRLANSESYSGEVDLAKALIRTLGERSVHEIVSRDSEEHKAHRLKRGIANNTIKKELRCLRRAMEFAVSLGLIREGVLPPVKGLPSRSRRDVWLRKEETKPLLDVCPQGLRDIVELLILTGARIGEALDLQVADWDKVRGVLFVPTEKQRGRSMREVMRELNVRSFGPRLAQLLESLVSHPVTGYLFHHPDGRPFRYESVARAFRAIRGKVGLGHLHLHDLRGTFIMHRAMVVKNFRQLQAEVGHGDAQSIQSYLDRAQRFNPEESIFYVQESKASQSEGQDSVV